MKSAQCNDLYVGTYHEFWPTAAFLGAFLVIVFLGVVLLTTFVEWLIRHKDPNA